MSGGLIAGIVGIVFLLITVIVGAVMYKRLKDRMKPVKAPNPNAHLPEEEQMKINQAQMLQPAQPTQPAQPEQPEQPEQPTTQSDQTNGSVMDQT